MNDKTPKPPRVPWHSVLDTKGFDSVRSDPRLPGLLSLARCVNGLRFAQTGLMRPVEYQTPTARRDRFNAFFYVGALLYEGLGVAERLGKHFKNVSAYRNGLQRLLADPKIKQLRIGLLKTLRNKNVFHFDDAVSAETLRKMSFPEYVFCTGLGPFAGNVYFDLADDALVNYLVGQCKDDAEFWSRLEQFMLAVTDLFERFTIAAQQLLSRTSRELGWRPHRKRRPRTGAS